MRKAEDIPGYCPHWKKKCVSVCPTCRLWVNIKGKRADGEIVDYWECATVAHILTSDVTNARVLRASEELEAMRNELAVSMDVYTKSLGHLVTTALCVQQKTTLKSIDDASNTIPLRLLERSECTTDDT